LSSPTSTDSFCFVGWKSKFETLQVRAVWSQYRVSMVACLCCLKLEYVSLTVGTRLFPADAIYIYLVIALQASQQVK